MHQYSSNHATPGDCALSATTCRKNLDPAGLMDVNLCGITNYSAILASILLSLNVKIFTQFKPCMRHGCEKTLRGS
jgi:hypothetical protein